MRTFTFTDEQVRLLLTGLSNLSTETAGLMGALNRPDNNTPWGKALREVTSRTMLDLLDLQDMLTTDVCGGCGLRLVLVERGLCSCCARDTMSDEDFMAWRNANMPGGE
jgi:hypothetical protein